MNPVLLLLAAFATLLREFTVYVPSIGVPGMRYTSRRTNPDQIVIHDRRLHVGPDFSLWLFRPRGRQSGDALQRNAALLHWYHLFLL